MPWIQVGSAVLGFFGSRSSRRRQRQAQRNQERIDNDRLGLARRQTELGERAYADWERRFGPLADRLASEASADVRPDFERIAGDNAAAFDSQRGATLRNMQRFGVSPDEGAWGNELRRFGTAEAASHVLNRNVARRGAQQERFSRLLSAYGAGSGLPGQAAAFMGGGAAGLAGVSGSAADRAAMYGNQASQDAYGAGQFFTNAWQGVRGMFGGGGGAQGGPWSSSYTPLRGPGPWRGTYGNPSTPWGNPWPSSPSLKTNIRPHDPERALATVNATPIYDFDYRSGERGKVGPMADEAPREIAPSGKAQDPQNTVNVLLGAVQALTRRLSEIESGAYGSAASA